jgi:cell wall-associated NlpC family hydrolase/spore germination cell wall hydrolase CwlJ-like protein
MFHGLEQADILDISVNGAGVVTNTDEVAKHLPKYEGYVDPDFYVFYPYTYASIKEASLENGDADPYTSTYKNKTPQPRTEEYTEYTYPDPTHDGTPSSVPVDYVENAGMTSLKQQFINLALSKIGCPYVWGAEGPDSFDCSGFISWCLKKMGIISSRFTTDSILSMTSVFKEKPLSEAKPGDLLHFKSKETRKIGHIAIYLGNNEIVHCGGSTDGTSKVNRRKADYVKFVRAIEVMPLYSSKQDKVVITNPKINYNFNKTLNLQYGSKGSAVEQLQALLNRIDNAELDIDGDFGSGTEQAVKNFQSKNNINPTGVVDSATTDAFEKAAENYTGPAEINSAVEYAYNSPADSGSITENELIEIARVVAAESMGEPYIGQIAVAQCIYDRFTDRKKRWGTLNKVLYTNGAFAKPFDGSLKTTTCLKAVKDVFCNGAKAYPNDQVHYFLSPKASAATFKDRDKNYTRLGVIANHTFWGDRGAGSSQRFITGGGSVDTNVQNTIPQQEEGIDKGYVTQTTKITTGVYNIPDAKKFGRPIIVKTECLLDDTFFADKNKKMKEHINNDINIFNSMFVDMVEYSGKGRLIKAFPTYLFTIVDENGEWLDGRKLWANHYVLRSLVDIQVHASNDMPMSTATITVTNSYDNLSKLPDGMRYYKISNDSEYNSVQKWAYKTFGIVLGFGPKLTDTLVELKNIVYDTMVVRAGCRMHLRMGYGSDPLALPTVMNGFISDLSVGDLMTFVCVSDGVELTNAILSSKPSDINGMFEAQESSNIISNMLCKRAKAFWSKVNDKWGEASKYGVEHFGLYFHEGFFGADTSTWGDWSSRIGNILSLSGRSVFEGSFTNQDQYDLCKNLYRGSYTKDYFTYTSFGELFMDDEKNICFNLYNKTPWDAIQMSVQNTPEYLGMPMYHQFDSRLYYGLPVWLAKYRYDLFNGSVYEECKTFSQMHFIDSLGEIIDNQVTTSSRNLYTNAIVMYTLGKSYHASPILYSDKSMNWSRMKTKILDTSITQNLIGPDAVYQFFGVKVAKNGAVRVGSSQLLYNWERNYQGELFIIGDGSIKPTDYIFMNDGFVDMVGLCTARTVTHSLSANTGFITTITPGMIGFSTLNNSRMSVTLANAITIGASFSSYTAIRKALKDSTEYLGNYYNQAERWLDIGFFGGLGIKGLTTAFVVYKNIELIIKIKNTAKTAFNIVKTGQTLAKISEGIKMAKTAMTGVKIGTMIKTGLSTAGTILAPGIGTIVGLALGFIADWALSFVVDYFAYNNCVCLLPLIYQGEAFCSELTGDKLLLTNGSNLSEEETYPNLDGSPEALSGDIVGEGQTSQTSAATQAALGQTQSYMGNQAIVILDDLGV